MNLVKALFLIAFAANCYVTTLGQETSIDLRKDGRVMTEYRKNNFLNKVKSKQIQLERNLHIRFGASKISAIVVPEDKTNGKYLIGVVSDGGTLPIDWEIVRASDFAVIRQFATNARYTAVEKTYFEIRSAVTAGDGQLATAKTNELRTVIGDGGDSASYAGYLLQDLDGTAEAPKFSDLISRYRKETADALRASIVAALVENRLPSAVPFVVLEPDDLLTLADLESSVVEREPGGVSKQGYLMIWHDRTLIVVSEKAGSPYSAAKYEGGVMEYLQKNNSSIMANNNALIRNRAVPN